MKNMERKIRARQNWLQVYEQQGTVTKTALRCGIARSTLYRWIKRYEEEGKTGLSDKSKRPLNLSNTKITEDIESMILELRKKRKWGSQRVSPYLLRKGISLSPMTVWRVLSKYQVKPIVKRRKKADYTGCNQDQTSGLSVYCY